MTGYLNACCTAKQCKNGNGRCSKPLPVLHRPFVPAALQRIGLKHASLKADFEKLA
jgi:hypothetical protein